MKTILLLTLLGLNLDAPAAAQPVERYLEETAQCAALWRTPNVSTSAIKEMFDAHAGQENFERTKAVVAAYYLEKGQLGAALLNPFEFLEITTQSVANLAARGDWVIKDTGTLSGPVLSDPSMDPVLAASWAPVLLNALALTLPEPFPQRSSEWTRRINGSLSVELPENWIIQRDASFPWESPVGDHIHQSLWLNLGPMPWSPEALFLPAVKRSTIAPSSLDFTLADKFHSAGMNKWHIREGPRRVEKPGWECYAWTQRRGEGYSKTLEGIPLDEKRYGEGVNCADYEAHAVCASKKHSFSMHAELPDLAWGMNMEMPVHVESRALFDRVLQSVEIKP